MKRFKRVFNVLLCPLMVIALILITPQDVYATKKVKLSNTNLTLYVGEIKSIDLYDGKSQVLNLKWN